MPTTINIIEWRNAILESDLTASEKLVCMALAKFYRPNYDLYPSIHTLALNTSITERSLYRLIESLQNKKVISVEKKQLKYAKVFHNVYTLLPTKECYNTPDSMSPTETMSPLTQSRRPLTTPLTPFHPTPDTESQTPDSMSPEIDNNIDNEKEKKIKIEASFKNSAVTPTFLSDKKMNAFEAELKLLSSSDRKILNKIHFRDVDGVDDFVKYITACCNNGITKPTDQLSFLKECVRNWGYLRSSVSDMYNADMGPYPNIEDVLVCFNPIKNLLYGYVQCC